MALELGTAREAAGGLRILDSQLHDLNFAFFVICRHDRKPGHIPPPWWEQMQRERPDLIERVRRFWGQPDHPAFDELLILAHHTGTVLDETLDRFFERLPAALQQRIRVPPLPTEPPDAPAVLEERLERLRASPALRDEYVTLVKETWAFVQPFWEQQRAAAREAVANLKRRPRTLDELRRSLPGCTLLRRQEFGQVLAEALANDEIVVTPLALGGDGQSVYSLPGVLLIGVGVEANRRFERKREQAERAANRLKVLADPTRVAILAQLMHNARSITDIATYFDLSQPTVSVHMKALREAGLVEAEKAGNQTLYRSNPRLVAQYVAVALAEIGVNVVPA